MRKRKLIPFRGDRSLWMVVFALLIISLLVVYSSTVSYAYANSSAGGDTSYFLFKQARFIVFSIILMFIIHWINFKAYARYIRTIFYLSVILVLAAYLMGKSLNDASRWLPIPFFGSFQPSEMLKVSLAALLAIQLGKRSAIISDIPILPALTPSKWKQNPQMNRDILNHTTKPILFPIAIACLVVLLTNFSTTVLIFVVAFITLMVAQIRRSEIRKIFLVGALGAIVAVGIMSITGIGRIDTAQNRIESFANAIIGYNTSSDKRTPTSSTTEDGDSMDQNANAVSSTIPGEGQQAKDSLNDDKIDLILIEEKWLPSQSDHAKIAITTGGIIGKGPGNSTQRSQLPLSYSDFAYAFIVEEYGLIGGVVVLILFLWVFYRSGVIIRNCRSTTNALLVLGLSLTITMQALINMMVCVGLGPVTGQPLPLVSMGGSSVLFTCIAFGIILSVSRQNDEEDAEEARLLKEGDQMGDMSNDDNETEQSDQGYAQEELPSRDTIPDQHFIEAQTEVLTKKSAVTQSENSPDQSEEELPFVVVDRRDAQNQPDQQRSKNVIDLYE